VLQGKELLFITDGCPGALLYVEVWIACQKICIKLLKEINLGVAQALFDPKKTPLETGQACSSSSLWERNKPALRIPPRLDLFCCLPGNLTKDEMGLISLLKM